MRPGNGALRFKANVPASVKLQIAEWLPETGPGASVVVTPTPIDPHAIGDAAALSVAIYRGRIDNRPSQFDIEFTGMSGWLDTYLDTAVSRSAGTPTQWLGDLLVNGLTVGTVSGGSNVTRTLAAYSVSNREALDAIASAGGWEYRVNPDLTVDAGTSVFRTTPQVVISERPAGRDGTLIGLNASLLDQGINVGSIATDVVVLGTGAGSQLSAATDSKSTSLKAPDGTTPALVAMVNAPSEPDASLAAAATAALNLFNTRRSVQVGVRDPMVRAVLECGDFVYLFAPEAGITDATEQVVFRGEVITPAKVRVLSVTWPIDCPRHGCYIRSNDGEWLDVTQWVQSEGEDVTLTVGDYSPPASGMNRSNPAVEERTTDASPQQAWTPTCSGLTVGNGVWAASWQQRGKWVDFIAHFVFGTTSAVTGRLLLTLPKAQAALTLQGQFNAGFYDNSAGVHFAAITGYTGTATQTWIDAVATAAAYGSGQGTTAHIPMTWATNDRIGITGSYPVA